MNYVEEIIQAICIALVVSNFFLNTGRALKAIELCKESLGFSFHCYVTAHSRAWLSYGVNSRSPEL